jgi:2-polyprenyl-3-methyl-5-hydroxy-6-metoxy-1,4-benzoquinol methylase
VIDVCPLCGSDDLPVVAEYDTRPSGETDFGLNPYRRAYRRCTRCGHVTADFEMELDALYTGDYVDATYGSDRLRASFDRIMALPPEESDNAGRVARIERRVGPAAARRVLDVGSGLAVFGARMKEHGWSVTALDPDPRAAAFARDVVGLDVIEGDFMTIDGVARYDLVTFNKVLEHVSDPVSMLARARPLIAEGGALYLEVPDADGAAGDPDGYMREEFFIEHLHVFSRESTSLLAEQAGFLVESMEAVLEPSGKYTIWALLRPAASPSLPA